MKKILITGGTGFIGYHLANCLSKKEENEIVIVDNLQRGRKDEEFTKLLENKNITFLELDLTEPSSYDKIGDGYEHVYHLAAINGTKYFYEMPHEVLRVNTLSIAYMLEWMRQKKQRREIPLPIIQRIIRRRPRIF